MNQKGYDELQKTFKNCPHCFLSEHDIHSSLYNIIKKELKQLGIDIQTTRDGYTTSLVHHEYPTPFRCDMQKYNFRVTSDKEKTPKGGLYKRGHYDLVIFNPEFIKNHKLDVVSGKDYQRLQAILPKLTIEPLFWACEIIYFPKNERLPKNAIKIIEQDTLKVKATLNYKIMDNKTFCKTGSVNVITGFPQTKTASLQQATEKLTKKHKIEIALTTA